MVKFGSHEPSKTFLPLSFDLSNLSHISPISPLDPLSRGISLIMGGLNRAGQPAHHTLTTALTWFCCALFCDILPLLHLSSGGCYPVHPARMPRTPAVYLPITFAPVAAYEHPTPHRHAPVKTRWFIVHT